jgi:hypothetical protein
MNSRDIPEYATRKQHINILKTLDGYLIARSTDYADEQ